MNNPPETKQCSRCHSFCQLEEIPLNRRGIPFKLCERCRKTIYCAHGKQKARCKDCGGYQICEHGKQKARCRECGGSQICEHNIIRSHCKQRGGSQICEHNRKRSHCKDCGGSQICEHNKQRSQCKQCGGSQICEHNRKRSHCKDCGGSQICEHGKQKIFCKQCGGSQICEHNRIKDQCADCGTGMCPNCHLFQTNGKLCATCNPNSTTHQRYDKKRPEIKTLKYLEEHLTMYLIHDKAFGTSCNYFDRPDIVVPLDDRILIVEVDEDAHQAEKYTERCEWRHVFNITSIFNGKQPVMWVRFNPNNFKGQPKEFPTRMANKLPKLLEFINLIGKVQE